MKPESDGCSFFDGKDLDKILEDMKKLAMEYGLDPGIVDRTMADMKAWTIEPDSDPLMEALEARPFRLEPFLAALEAGADPNSPRKRRSTTSVLPLHQAAYLGDIGAVKALLKHGAKVNAGAEAGAESTVLMGAISSGSRTSGKAQIDLVKLLLEEGADPNGATAYGETPLKHAWHRREYELVDLLLHHGADESQLKMTPLLWAVHKGRLEEVSGLLAAGADPRVADFVEENALEAAVRRNRLNIADILLSHMGFLDEAERNGVMKAAVLSNCPEVLDWLVGQRFDPQATSEVAGKSLIFASQNACPMSSAWLIEQAGEDGYGVEDLSKALEEAHDGETSLILLKAGAGVESLDSDSRPDVTGWHGAERDSLDGVTQDDYDRAKLPRFGSANPDEASEPFWVAMIKNRMSAFRAAGLFSEGSHGSEELPRWSANRFGQSLTFLPDGRIVEIAGEHEDSYDMDFCIYNDVFVHEPGKCIRVFLYPESVFPPTDFHSATLIGNFIYIIGSMGYRHVRAHQVVTPVYRLDLNSMAINKVETSGEMPGRICRHRANRTSRDEIRVSEGLVVRGEELVPLEGIYTLNLETMVWRRQEA